MLSQTNTQPPAASVRLRIPDILDERNLTATDLARITGLTYNTCSAIARGFYDRIGLETIAKLCAGLELAPGDLFEFTQER